MARNLVRSSGLIDAEGANLIFLDPNRLTGRRVPRRALPSGAEAYPAPIPAGRMKFVAHLWEAWDADGALEANSLAALLWNDGDGIGTKSLGARGADRQISRETLREEMAELIHRMKLPIVGYHLAGGRKEIDQEIDGLTGRVLKMKEAGRGQVAAHQSAAWWKDPAVRSSILLDGYEGEVVRAVVDRLEARPLKARELAFHLRQTTERKWTDSDIRQLIHELRIAGVPIVSSTTRGSHIAADRDELKEFLLRYRARIDAIEERITDLGDAAQIWFPRDQIEANFARRWCENPPLVGRSARRLQRDRARAEAASRRNETLDDERQIQKEAAQARIDRDSADPVFRSLLALSPDDLTAEEKRRVENFRDDQDLLAGRRRRRRRRSGRRRGSTQIVASSSAASLLRGDDEVQSAPW
jgi:hypothetical protein